MITGERIRRLRKEKKWTQKQLADHVKESPQVISNWERGYTHPDMKNIIDLSITLQSSTDYLLGLSDYPFDATVKIKEIIHVADLLEGDLLDVDTWESFSKEEMQQIINFFQFINQNKQNKQ
ncbi:helix-turn-helix domain-containing protein [Thalassobacillus hwangdonensis]|uniref:Helix-turn-helix domain-containing protein n=1 Tax=Thalassobacillus hwangdonensis TaxID=546108 RepID=A0ABW3KXJ3_9BACI